MKKILVPCDFSREATNALRSADAFYSAEIHVLHVIELPVVHESVMMPVLGYQEALLQELREKAQVSFRDILSGLHIHTDQVIIEIMFGPVERVILNYIRDQAIDLVIMGTKGVHSVLGLLLGSTTEKIVRSSKAPVLVVRNVLKPGSVQRIAFPTDIDFDDLNQLVAHVRSLQQFFGASLHLVRINTPANFCGDAKNFSRLEEFAHTYRLSNYHIHVYNDLDNESGIINFSRFIKADMLVMATHGKKGLGHLFAGSLTEDVVNHIDLPVWTLSLPMKEDKVLFDQGAK